MATSRNTPEPKNHLVSTAVAGKAVDVSPGQIRQLVADGKLKGYKVGRLLKVDINEVQSLVVVVDNS